MTEKKESSIRVYLNNGGELEGYPPHREMNIPPYPRDRFCVMFSSEAQLLIVPWSSVLYLTVEVEDE
jgi:hypothetical protein